MGCRARKYGCDKTGKPNEKTMWVTWPVSDSDSESELEVVEEPKGKKRQASSPVPPKKKAKKVKVKVEKEEKPKAKPKPKAKARQRAVPKSAPTLDTSDEEDAMVVDEASDVIHVKPKPTRARVVKGKSSFFFLF